MKEEKQIMIIMRGIPGSGKSTAANTLKQVLTAVGSRKVGIFSTDDFWYRDGVYDWDAKKIGAAHCCNQTRVKNAITNGMHVIVDNTNLDGFAMMPYFDMAVAADLDVILHTVDTPVETCIERQKERSDDRKVPEHVIRDMHDKLTRNQDITVESQLNKARIRSQLRSQLSW